MKRILLLVLAFPAFLQAQSCLDPGTGADGAFHATSNMTLAGGEYNFTSFTIDPGVTVSITGTSPLIVHCTGAVLIDGILSANGGNGTDGVTYSIGGTGGIGVAGGANGGDGSYSSSSGPLPGTAGSGPGGVNNHGDAWSGGGGGGYASAGGATSNGGGGFAGPSYGTADLTGLEAGSGGGGGSGGYSCGSGGGGAGGGLIVFNMNGTMTIGAAGMISCDGGNGGSDGTGNCGGGGGGSGGSIFLRVATLDNNGTIRAIGGTGGASMVNYSPYYGGGGNGSEGRIRIDYETLSGSGTVQPASGFTATPLITSAGTVMGTCTSSQDGDGTIIVSGGVPSYTYAWSNGEMTNPAVNLPAGTASCTITDADGCTATATITVPVLDDTVSQTFTVCAGESVTVGASVHNASGNYTDVLTNIYGCDSTVHTALTVLPAINTTQSATICQGESVTVGNSTYTTAGNYTDVLTAADGCDSTVQTAITVNSVNTALTVSNAVMQATQTQATYQWFDCDNDTPVAGATSQTFIPTANGNYAVIVTFNGCTDTSTCTAYNFVSTNDLDAVAMQLYPNPTSGTVTLVFATETAVEGLTVTDASGRVVKTEGSFTASSKAIDLSNEGKGIYFLHVRAEGKSRTLKITKQ